MMNFTESMPKGHAAFLEHALAELRADERIVGVAIGGSFVTGTLDEFSDLDLVLVIDPLLIDEVMPERKQIAARLGNLVGAFTGEHVGEPRLLICLYDHPVLHADLKFVSLPDMAHRVEDPEILWDREGQVADMLVTQAAEYPMPDLQWIEDRFWIWVHYMTVKIGRGELFETIAGFSFLRTRVLGTLALMEAGVQPSGVRKIETMAPARAQEMWKTLPVSYDRQGCIASLQAVIAMYLSLREALGSEFLQLQTEAERVAMRYLAEITHRNP
jgi:predicted nucleotidyltransferase